MAAPSYRLLEHPADLGFEVQAPSLSGLFAAAAAAFLDILWDPAGIAPREHLAIEVSGEDLPELLVAFLGEILFLAEARGFGFCRIAVGELAGGRLAGQAWGEPWDPQRHQSRTVVKAVTYHQIFVGQEGEAWRARVFLDL
ncbi:MAG: archease [Thermodesulfobacteriota bacterium]